jgi:hypothetical protein
MDRHLWPSLLRDPFRGADCLIACAAALSGAGHSRDVSLFLLPLQLNVLVLVSQFST